MVPASKSANPTTVNEVMPAFWHHAESHYRRDDGSAASELSEYRQTFKILRSLCGRSPASGSARGR